ncbi:GH36-type glycosyl hydrolase domain-containing protein [Sphingobacterium psychroaquaticum]|uniref:Glycosyl hydrolase 94 catalytic domain-containing protein n=1 Tax=Sphingobacterium psychroaquaticum TaxID=561061 RepID=A0A1X7IH13_9SPHI|nr:hypothetical protein [Sphingobacterium psychroaquaticum]SMG14026.1 hypothetical protein SAMN05660862_0821 [Sphingobacterium psychroaquaticum]
MKQIDIMKYKNFLWTALAVATISSAVQGQARMSDTLQQSIRSSSKLTQVTQMAEKLVQSGFTAGDGYGEVWIRDLNSFVELSTKVNGQERTREALLMFFKFQQPDGNIPDGYIPAARAGAGYVYQTSPYEPDYRSHKNTVETDQETSLIQAVHKYIQATGDRAFLHIKVGDRTVADRMHDALQYLLDDRFNAKYGLLWGATTVDWGDVQPEHEWGVALDSSSHPAIDIYDNAMFVIAINNYLDLIDDRSRQVYWTKVGHDITKNTRKYLWDKKRQKYRPHIYLDKGSPFPNTFDEEEIYYHGGTFTAIEAGFLTKKEIREAYLRMQDNVKKSGAPSIGLTVYPPYPNGTFENKGLGEYSYQNGGDWTWFGGRMVQQLIRVGMYEEAYEALAPMVDLVLDHKGFYEWWTRDGKPAGSASFRGAAGVLWKSIEMLHEQADSNKSKQ